MCAQRNDALPSPGDATEGGGSPRGEALTDADAARLVGTRVESLLLRDHDSSPSSAVSRLDAFAVDRLLRRGLSPATLGADGASLQVIAMCQDHTNCSPDDVSAGVRAFLPVSKRHLAASTPPQARDQLHVWVSPLIMLRTLQSHGCVYMADEETYPDQVSPLHWAAREDCPHCVRQLLRSGHSVNSRAADGCTPLMHAAYFGRFRAVSYLLTMGARVDLRSVDDPWTRRHGNANASVVDYAKGCFSCQSTQVPGESVGTAACYCETQTDFMDLEGKRRCLSLLLDWPESEGGPRFRVPPLQQLCCLALHEHTVRAGLAPMQDWELPPVIERLLASPDTAAPGQPQG